MSNAPTKLHMWPQKSQTAAQDLAGNWLNHSRTFFKRRPPGCSDSPAKWRRKWVKQKSSSYHVFLITSCPILIKKCNLLRKSNLSILKRNWLHGAKRNLTSGISQEHQKEKDTCAFAQKEKDTCAFAGQSKQKVRRKLVRNGVIIKHQIRLTW